MVLLVSGFDFVFDGFNWGVLGLGLLLFYCFFVYYLKLVVFVVFL